MAEDTAGKFFTRLEYLNHTGWHVGHEGVWLLHPQRYVERMDGRDNGNIGKATVLDPETGEVLAVYESANMPGPCQWCDEVHSGPFHGGCLL